MIFGVKSQGSTPPEAKQVEPQAQDQEQESRFVATVVSRASEPFDFDSMEREPMPFVGLKTFVLAGRAVFTLTDLESGKHYTYRVNKSKPNKQYPLPIWWVSLGIGYEDSIPAGRIFTDERYVGPNTSKLNSGSPSIKLFTEWWTWVKSGDERPAPCIRFQHEGKCCVCGRPLTNPESIEMGIGPECAGRG